MTKQKLVPISQDTIDSWTYKVELSLDLRITNYCPFFPKMNQYCDCILGYINKEETQFSVNTLVYGLVKKWMEKELNISIMPNSEMNKIIPRKKRKLLINKLLQDFEISAFDPFKSILIADIFIIIGSLASFVLIFVFIHKDNVPLGMLAIGFFIALIILSNKWKTKFTTPTFIDFTNKFARDRYYEFNPDKDKLNFDELRTNMISMLSEIMNKNITEDTQFELYIPTND